MYPKGGADRETVAYGTIVSGFTPGTGTKELGEATRQLISSIRDTNPALRLTGNAKDLTVGGRAAKSVELLGSSAIREKGQPVPERIRLVAVQAKGSLILYLVFVAPDADFGLMRPAFDGILRSFAPRWTAGRGAAMGFHRALPSVCRRILTCLRVVSDNPSSPFGVPLIRNVRSSTSTRAYNLRKWGPGPGQEFL